MFGWDGWSFEVISCDCILERSKWDEDSTHKGRHTVAYRVTGRLSIRDKAGRVLATFEDGATGDAQNQPGFADAHDMALKTAMSQALKRCAVNLGDRFGLSLYNKGAAVAVVGKSLAHSSTGERDTSEHVDAGELEQQDTEARIAARAEQVKAETPGLADRAAAMRDKVAGSEPEDKKLAATGERS